MSSKITVSTAADFMEIDNDLSYSRFYSNLIQASIETTVIFGLYVVVVAGRSLTNRNYLKALTQIDLWTWVALFLVINTLLKTYYPRFDDQLLNAAVFNVVLTMMTPLKIEHLG